MRSWLPRLASILGPHVVRGLGCTLRVRYSNAGAERELIDSGGLIYCFWHRWILLPAYTHRKRGIVVLISRHNDGEIISRIVHRLGFETARGSSTRGGARALIDLKEAAARGKTLAFTPDGPRGPSKSVAPGIVHVAAHTGLPILPCGMAITRERCLDTWDRFVVPRPFSKAWIHFGEPLRFQPEDLAEDVLASNVERVRLAMLAAEGQAEEDLARSQRRAP